MLLGIVYDRRTELYRLFLDPSTRGLGLKFILQMASALEALQARAEAAEGEIEGLAEELQAMKRGAAEVEEPAELVKLRADNSRLRYRVGVLSRAVEEEAAAGQGRHMVDIRGVLVGMFQV